jgi:hypothetical protein
MNSATQPPPALIEHLNKGDSLVSVAAPVHYFDRPGGRVNYYGFRVVVVGGVDHESAQGREGVERGKREGRACLRGFRAS